MNRNSRDHHKYRQSNKHGRPPVKLRQCYPISGTPSAEMLSRTFKISSVEKPNCAVNGQCLRANPWRPNLNLAAARFA
jgi:hypothetical protein